MSFITKKVIISVLSLGLVAQLTACGTILHPERKGQQSGNIDPAIALLDAAGLLLFFIPGIIAFAVDFNNGTIYLPKGRHASLDAQELQRIAPNGTIIKSELINVLSEKGLASTGITADDMQTSAIESIDQVYSQLAMLNVTYARN